MPMRRGPAPATLRVGDLKQYVALEVWTLPADAPDL